MPEPSLAERIRECAFLLWQLDGSLEGCSDEYWRMARALMEREARPDVAHHPFDSDCAAAD
ncbi:DUF2934 domain-containing protein [Paraburkholderia sp. RL18-103-BIB-C]|jgi:hypothetical protein|uniref:DUF2934 domain-containing protein n=1 Tax=unclassified Paraburkholderia TaxID=2615204 RepID=UPI002F77F88B